LKKVDLVILVFLLFNNHEVWFVVSIGTLEIFNNFNNSKTNCWGILDLLGI